MAGTAIARSVRSSRDAGWLVNPKRVERIWKREGLKVPTKQPKRGRLWLTDGSCIRLRPEHRNPVWSYDFVEERTQDGRKFRLLNLIDAFTHECLAIRVAGKLKAIDGIDVLADLFMPHAAFQAPSAPTTVRSSWPRPCRSGSRRLAPKRRRLSGVRRGRTATSRASMPGCGTNCWTGRSSTPCARRKSSSRAGDGTPTLCARTLHWARGHPLQRCLCPLSLHGRRRSPDRLRRPSSPWCSGQQ
jgi:hypothetical protein